MNVLKNTNYIFYSDPTTDETNFYLCDHCMKLKNTKYH